jgi:hypothetical protein
MTIFNAPTDAIGAIVRIHVTDASPHTLFGDVMEIVSPARTRTPSSAAAGLPILPPSR